MAELSDVTNEILRDEIEEFIERPEEIARTVALFTKARPLMQEIAAAIIEGDDSTVDTLTKQALDDGIEAAEIMEHFQWTEEVRDKEALADELADVALYLLQLASVTEIDLGSAILGKLEKNYQRDW